MATSVLHDEAKYGFDLKDALNRIEIRLKTRHHAILASRFIVERAIENAPVCDVALAMVAELTVQIAGNVDEHTLVVLQTTQFLNKRKLVT